MTPPLVIEPETESVEQGDRFQPVKYYDNRRQTERRYWLVVRLTEPTKGRVRASFAPVQSVEGTTEAALDLRSVAESLEQYAAEQGEDLGALLELAAAHFHSQRLESRKVGLSHAELDALTENDLRISYD